MYECTSSEEVVDLLRGGQGVFGIAVSGALRELVGSLAHLPGERADGGADARHLPATSSARLSAHARRAGPAASAALGHRLTQAGRGAGTVDGGR